MKGRIAILLSLIFISVSDSHASTETKILPNDGSANKAFGQSVSICGNYAIVGAYKDGDKGNSAGAAYIFRQEGTRWIQEAKLTAEDASPHDYFGYSVSISEDCAVAGAFNHNGRGKGAGKVYVFRRGSSGWDQEAELTASDGQQNDYFGYSVSVSGDYIIAGAYRDDDSGKDSGAAYIFKRSGSSWNREAKLVPNDITAGNHFGRSVSIYSWNGDCYAMAGAIHHGDRGGSSGAAYIFRRSGTAWIQETELTPDDIAAGDFFGFSVSVSGSNGQWYAAVGADADDDYGDSSGSVYVFHREGARWNLSQKLMPDEGTGGDFFGRSVSISGEGGQWYLMTGADGDDTSGYNAGAAYIFKHTGTQWIRQAKLTPAGCPSGSRLGWSVSLCSASSGYYAISGAYREDNEGTVPGAVYVWAPASESPDIQVSPQSLILRESGAGASTRESGKREPEEVRSAGSQCATGLVIPKDIREYWASRITPPRKPPSKSLPDSVDWSIYDSSVRYQGSCGSCWAFAATALIENLGNQANLSVDQDLSEQVLLSCATGDCGGGWYWDALNYTQKNGIPSESCYAYKTSKGNCDDKCGAPEFLQKITRFTPSPGLWGEDQTVEDLKEALQDGPLCVAMRVPDDGTFTGRGYTGGVYDYDGDAISWELNGHAVLLVAYDDTAQCFKAKNSWGDWWGEDGYFRISYDDVSDDVKFGSYACNASGAYIDEDKPGFTVSNTGTGELVISSVSANKSWINFSPRSFFPVAPGGKQTIDVSVANWNAVAVPGETGEITINCNDPDEPMISIEVKAIRSLTAEVLTLLVSPPFKEISDSGGQIAVHVSNSGNGSMDWTAETDTAWLNIISGTSGTGSGTVTIDCEANTGDSRTGVITVTAPGAENSPQTVKIIQSGGEISGVGDTGDTEIISNLPDVIKILRMLAGEKNGVNLSADKSGNHQVGLEDAILSY
jgi:C1A family cysteine protease